MDLIICPDLRGLSNMFKSSLWHFAGTYTGFQLIDQWLQSLCTVGDTLPRTVVASPNKDIRLRRLIVQLADYILLKLL